MVLYSQKYCQSAFSLLEIILAIALFGLLILSAGAYAGFSLAGLTGERSQSQAQALADEAAAVVRLLARRGWTNLPYQVSGLSLSGGVWSLAGEGSSEPVGAFQRQLTFNPVCRDGANLLVDCPAGSPDSNAKQVVIDISWSDWSGAHDLRETTYVANWR